MKLRFGISPFDLFDSSEDIWVWRDYLSFPVSESLGQVLDKLLQNATRRRYQSAMEVLNQVNSPLKPPKTVFTNSTDSPAPATPVLSATVFDPQTQSWYHIPNLLTHSESVWAVVPFLRPHPTNASDS